MNSWKKFLVCCGRKLCWPILAVFVFIPAASRAGSDADQIEILIAPFLAPQVLLTRIKSAIIEFVSSTDEGSAMMAATGYDLGADGCQRVEISCALRGAIENIVGDD